MSDLYSTQLDTTEHDKEHQRRRSMFLQVEKDLNQTEKELIDRRKSHRRLQGELGISRENPSERSHSRSRGKRHGSNRKSARRFRTQTNDEDFDAEGVEQQLQTLRANVGSNNLLSERSGLLDFTQGFSDYMSTNRNNITVETSYRSHEPQIRIHDTNTQYENTITFGDAVKENVLNAGNKPQSARKSVAFADEIGSRRTGKKLEMKGEEDMYEELQAIKNELKRVQESEEALVREKQQILEEKKKYEEEINQLKMKCREIELYTIKNEEYKAFKKIAALEEENFVLKEKLEETIRADEKEITALKDELRILHERLKGANYRPSRTEESTGRFSPGRISSRITYPDTDAMPTKESFTRERSPPRLTQQETHDLITELRKLSSEVSILRDTKQDLSIQNQDLRRQLEESRVRSVRSGDAFEDRVVDLQKEVEFWKVKCDRLTNKYYGYLKKLRNENDELRKTVQTQISALEKEAKGQIEALHTFYRKDKSAYLEEKLEDSDKVLFSKASKGAEKKKPTKK